MNSVIVLIHGATFLCNKPHHTVLMGCSASTSQHPKGFFYIGNTFGLYTVTLYKHLHKPHIILWVYLGLNK